MRTQFALPLLPGMLVAALVGAATPGCANGEDERRVIVFAASSLSNVFAEIADAFMREHPGVGVDLQFAGSSTLSIQITEGAQVDVFASANERVMEDLAQELEESALEAGAGSREESAGSGEARRVDAVVFAQNQLALAVPADNPGGIKSLESLTERNLLVAACAPDVPCGELAQEALSNLGAGSEVIDTYEPSVRSVLGKVLLGEVDVGLVYITDLEAAGDEMRGFTLEQPPTTSYPLAVLSHKRSAQKFADFVLSSRGQEILAEAGFLLP